MKFKKRAAGTRSVRSNMVGPIAIIALVVSIGLLSTPAGAATTCAVVGDEIFVSIDGGVGAETRLRMSDDVLLVNDVPCNTSPVVGGQVTINVTDAGDPKVDHVVIDVTEPFLIHGVVAFVKLVLAPDDQGVFDQVTILGSQGVDDVVLKHDVLTDSADTFLVGGDKLRVVVGWTPNIRLALNLGGGDDTLTMPVDADGKSFRMELSVRGGPGNDVLRGGPGRQEIRGGGGDDTISGGSGSDELWGNSGDDTISGGSGSDELWGNAGADTISGGRGSDTIRGGTGPDILRGNKGADLIRGNGGADRIWGGPGKDRVFGGRGSDTFFMKDGWIDRVVGGRGRTDVCTCNNKDVLRGIEELS